MNILMIGADPSSPTDGVITKGIRYLLEKTYLIHEYTYVLLDDHKLQGLSDFEPNQDFNLIVICGTPWLWDSFHLSHKYKNVLTAFAVHPDAKRLFLGIGSCLSLDAHHSILRRKEEVDGMRRLFTGSRVIVRDQIAKDILDDAFIHAELLPCPAYFCYGDDDQMSLKMDDILIFQDPTLSISAADWLDPYKLSEYWQGMLEYQKYFDAKVYCALSQEVVSAKEQGFGDVTLLNGPEHTLNVMRHARTVLSGRVHCAVPAIVQGADTTIMPLDTRASTVTDFKTVADFRSFLPKYQEILKRCVK